MNVHSTASGFLASIRRKGRGDSLPIPGWGCAGFTLVELIVAITLVAILAALTLSATQRVTAASQIAICANNLHQLYGGVGCYMGDNNGYLPAVFEQYLDPSTKTTVSLLWWQEISPYIPCEGKKNLSVNSYVGEPRPTGLSALYLCPANPLMGPGTGLPNVLNYVGVINASGSTYVPYPVDFRRKLASFANPLSTLPFITDGYPQSGGAAQLLVSAFSSLPSTAQSINTANPVQGLFRPVHGMNINVLFLDGHVDLVDIRTFAVNSSTTYNYRSH